MMKKYLLLVNILGIFAMGYLFFATQYGSLDNPVTSYVDPSGISATVLTLAACVALLALVTVALVLIYDLVSLFGKRNKA